MESPHRPPDETTTTTTTTMDRNNGTQEEEEEEEEEAFSPLPPPRIVYPPQDEPSPHSHSIPVGVGGADGGGRLAPLDLDVLIGGDRDGDGDDDGLPPDPHGIGTPSSRKRRDPQEYNLFTDLRRRWGGRKPGRGAAADDDDVTLPTRQDRDEPQRKLRQRERLERRLRPWTVCGVEVARAWERLMEAVLPESMRTVHVEAGTRRWLITDRALELWALLRAPLLVTSLVLLAAMALWWAAGPALAMLGPAPVEVPTSLRDVGGGLGVPARVDGAGVYMERPLAICGLLYDRREAAASRDEAWARLYRELFPPLVERVAQSGLQAPAPDPHGGARLMRSNVLLVDPKALNGPRTALPAHQDSKRWRALRDSGAVWPTPSRRDARMFHEKTRAWLQRECARAPGRDRFIRDAKERGYIRLDVTEYIEPPPREPTPPPPPPSRGGEDDDDTGEGGAEAGEGDVSAFDALLQLDEERDEEEDRTMGGGDAAAAGPAPEGGAEAEGVRMLAPPPPEPLYRNVSIYDLNMVLFHFAAQARDARAEWAAAPHGLAAGIAGALVDALAQFRAAVRVDAPRPRADEGGGGDSTQAHYQRLALQSYVEGRLRELLGEATELRSHALWGGAETGCVCAHHVGVPIPGAAWYEPADRERGEPARVRVLFYTTLEPDPLAPRDTPAEDNGKAGGEGEWLGWLRERVGDPLAGLVHTGAPQQGGEAAHAIEWDVRDPVLGADATRGPPRLALEAPQVRARLGRDADEEPLPPVKRYWVEGVSHDGWQRRYPIAAAPYACVASCQLACGGPRRS